MKFVDSKGREYDPSITLATQIALKKLGVDLMGHFDGRLWENLADDPELLVNVLAESVSESMIKNNVDAVEFAKSLGGDSLDAATTALRDAITDFFPPLQRAAAKKLIEKSDTVMKMAAGQMDKAIDNLTPEAILASMNSSGTRLGSQVSAQASSIASDSEN